MLFDRFAISAQSGPKRRRENCKLTCVGFPLRSIRIRRPKELRSRFRRKTGRRFGRGSSIWRERSGFQSIRRNVPSTRASRSRRPNSCASKRAMAQRAPFITPFREHSSPNTPIFRNAKSSSQSLNASASPLQTWTPHGKIAGFLLQSTGSSKRRGQPAPLASRPWAGRIGARSSG
jgi:hypothetical protein